MKDYEIEGVRILRDNDVRFSALTDAQMVALYREYSSECNCNGWTSMTPKGISVFKTWAFNSPFELMKDRVVYEDS